MTRSASAIDRAYAPRFCSSFEQRMFAEYGDKGGIIAGPVHAAHVDAGRRFDLVHIPADSLDVADGLYRAVDWLNAAESFIDGAAGVPYHQAEAALEVVLGAYLTKAQLTELIELCHQWSEAPSVALAALRDEDRADVVRALEAEAPAASLATVTQDLRDAVAETYRLRETEPVDDGGPAADAWWAEYNAAADRRDQAVRDITSRAGWAEAAEALKSAVRDAEADAEADQAEAEAAARWSRMAACSCNMGCNVCDPAPADWGAVEIVNGPRRW